MQIQITKRSDGSGLLRCVRHDGSATWQKQTERNAPHFALHDLTHFAVETTLGYSNGFFGLLKQGWEMDDVTGKGARGRLPIEAVEVEEVVGWFDSERACRANWSTEDFNHHARLRVNDGLPPSVLTREEIMQIKKCRADLFARWAAVQIGETLELEF